MITAHAVKAHFIVNVVDSLDLRLFTNHASGRYCSVASLRRVFQTQVERATLDSVAFRCIAEGSKPNHDTPATFSGNALQG